MSKEVHTTSIKDQETLITDTTLTSQQKHTYPLNSFKQTTTTFGSDFVGQQKVGTLLSKQNYNTTETSVGGEKQIYNTQTTSAQNTLAQHFIPPSSNHHMKKYLQEESTTSQPSKEVTHSQDKNLSFLKLNQQSNKAILFLLTPPPPLLFIPSYPSILQWQDNRRKLMLLLDKLDRKHKGLTSSPIPLMALLKEIHHLSSQEIEAQPGSSLTTSTSGKHSTDKMISWGNPFPESLLSSPTWCRNQRRLNRAAGKHERREREWVGTESGLCRQWSQLGTKRPQTMYIHLCRQWSACCKYSNKHEGKVRKAHLSWAQRDHKLRGGKWDYKGINVTKWVSTKWGPERMQNLGVCTIIVHSCCPCQFTSATCALLYSMSMWPDRHFRNTWMAL